MGLCLAPGSGGFIVLPDGFVAVSNSAPHSLSAAWPQIHMHKFRIDSDTG